MNKKSRKKAKSLKPVGPEKRDSKCDVPIDRLTILLRAYVTQRKQRKKKGKPPRKLRPSDWTLIFDTETKTDQSQRLRFGSYQLRHRGDLRERGIFYDPEVTEAEIAIINTVITQERAQALGERIYLMTRAEFVENVFLSKAYDLGTLIVGFNLPYDLSRLSIDYDSARKSMKGGFSFVLSERSDRPHLRIKHLNGHSALIDFAATEAEIRSRNKSDNKREKRRITERGYFVDLRTLSKTLTGQSHNLKSLSKLLKVKTPKIDSDKHGQELTEEYVRYGIRDAQTTWECFESLADRYASYGLNEVGIHELYSEASLGKAYLQAMNVRPWLEVQSNPPNKLIGHIMSAYYGGRSEVHLRREIVQVLHCDFLSMYPTVCALMGLWRFVISQGISSKEDTTSVRRFIKSVTVSDLQCADTWKHLNVLVQVLPEDDIFPVRARYLTSSPVENEDATATIGLNRLTRKKPLWFTLADCLVSKVLTGKLPRIVRAIRFTPQQIQNDLKPISIAGNQAYRIDPTTDDFYKRLIELRQDAKARSKTAAPAEKATLKSDQQSIKILANATSYGIFVELNVEDLDKPEHMICHGWKEQSWEITSKKFEKPGRYFHPLLGTLITGAARLMLALAEREALNQGLNWVFCDTDSIAIAKPDNLDEGIFIKRAVSVCDWFKPLNPYGSPGSKKNSILQVEDVNFRPGCEGDLGALEPLYCFAVSAKRYALFNKTTDGNISIRKASAHGLGHLLAPYEDPDRDGRLEHIGVELWQEDVWREIIKSAIDGHPDEVSFEHLPGFDHPAASRFAATTPNGLAWFRGYNARHPETERVHPFNFLLSLHAKSVVQSAAEDPQKAAGRRSERREPRPAAPYDKEVLRASAKAFDRDTGQPVPPEWLISLGRSLVRYHIHPETKFWGADYDERGQLSRRDVFAETIQPIGKEADKLEERETIGDDDAEIEYDLSLEDRAKLISLIKKGKKEFGLRQLALSARISHHRINDVIRGKTTSDHVLVVLGNAINVLRRRDTDKKAKDDLLLQWLRRRVTDENRTAIARSLGIDPSNLSKILKGRRRLSATIFSKLNALLSPLVEG